MSRFDRRTLDVQYAHGGLWNYLSPKLGISPSLGAGFLTEGELNSTYYRRFVKDFSIKTANLRKLLQRDAKFVWKSVHQQEFDFLKNALTSAPILAFPNMQKEFILTTDACTSGIAFILSQLDDQGREHVICYGGRGLRKSEINWSISELECLATVSYTHLTLPTIYSV